MFRICKRLLAFSLAAVMLFTLNGCSFIDEQWDVLEAERNKTASSDAEIESTEEEATTTTEAAKEQNALEDFLNVDEYTLGARIDTPNGFYRVNFVDPGADGELASDASSDGEGIDEIDAILADDVTTEAGEDDIASDASNSEEADGAEGEATTEARTNDLAEPMTIESFMRSLPVKEDGAKTLYYTTSPKENQDAHCAVLNIPLDGRDLQQSASSMMRLYAEYFWTNKAYDDMKFPMVNGFTLDYDKWINGERATFSDSAIQWTPGSATGDSYDTLMDYLQFYFAYSNRTVLLTNSHEADINKVSVGDYLVNEDDGGLAMVVDVAEDVDGNRCFLLASGGTPGQDIEILLNDEHSNGDPWYYVSEIKDKIKTPEVSYSPDKLYHYNYSEASKDAKQAEE
ncbi:MAG: DUF4846 domain-containing protein [Lachnospiraceae bacterium]|nr:DUF4846 domain-containing protein [Lachnospiraceae bacterium]